MQLNPARGRKPRGVLLVDDAGPLGLCSSTPRGDGNFVPPEISNEVQTLGLCSSTPRGDGNARLGNKHDRIAQRFMQLNPARGRKLAAPRGRRCAGAVVVYAAQPREGTETGA